MAALTFVPSGTSPLTVNATSAAVSSTTLMPLTRPTLTPAMRTSSPSSRPVTSAKRAR